jgi:hypothetical protein
LGALGVPGGDVTIFTALVDPVYHVGGIHHVDFYLTGGGDCSGKIRCSLLRL